MLLGAKDAYKDTISSNLEINSAARYAAIRHYLYTNKKYAFENVNFYDPHLLALGEQWKQMFCESEGKDKKGLFETCSLFTTDLHSLGQYFQDGTRNFYELTVLVTKPNKEIKLNFKNDEHFEYLNNKTLDFVNKAAFNGTIAAHTNEGKVNNIVIEIEHSDEYNYGYLSM
jgi:glucose-6-phosphate isomerase